MKIRGKTVFCYDVEVFSNLFTIAIKNSENNVMKHYEISERKNDLGTIISIFKNNSIWFCGYNNLHYDDPIINKLLLEGKDLIEKPVWEINKAIKDLSDEIINSKDNNFSSWTKYKYAHLFPTLDLLTMMFSAKLRVGLKETQVTMQYHNVQEYDGDFNAPCPRSDFDLVHQYNGNDTDSTCELMHRLEKDIQLRLSIEDEYGISVLSSDGVSIGKEILKKKYLHDIGKRWDEIKDLRNPCEYIVLKDIILPIISYQTPILQSLLEEMKTLTLHPGVERWSKTFDFFGTVVNIAEGGLHSINEPEIIEPTENQVLIDADAASLYPSLLIEWGFYPQHLGKEFLQTYRNIRTERLTAKRNGDKIKNETLKLALNSVTGLMQSEYSWLYSPNDVYKIRMNGQLLLLKLAEMLILATNCRIIQYNTKNHWCFKISLTAGNSLESL